GHARTFAEMTLEEKNQLSHRAKAFEGMKEFLKGVRSEVEEKPETGKKQFLITTLLTIIISVGSFLLLMNEFIGFGITLFIIVPFSIGFTLRHRPSWRRTSYYAIFTGLVMFSLLLLTAGLEAFFCLAVVFPLMVLVVTTGIFAGYLVRKHIKEENMLKTTLIPVLLIGISGSVENAVNSAPSLNKIETSLILPYKKEIVFDYIKSVDTLAGTPSLLLNIGLPIPQKCILEKEETGAKRICYFEMGSIEEVVTEYKPGERLAMKVTNFGLPGLHWLKFEDAIYTFKEVDGGTMITRTTTYTSELQPRLYWNFIEQKAIEAEHDYVLGDLKRRLEAHE
ncbi:MAG TPA: non-canonical purine NTP pyrophosphatase, partial [Bacteroidia bacterium]|nr:non-canonical purine NTP pyrophosphatase [Bacteroidia bacterium]